MTDSVHRSLTQKITNQITTRLYKHVYWVIEMMAHRVRQRTNRIVQYQQILVLVLHTSQFIHIQQTPATISQCTVKTEHDQLNDQT